MAASFQQRESARNAYLVLPSALLLGAFVLYPSGVAIYTSLTNLSLTGPAALNPRFIGLENYARLMQDGAFWKSLVVTFWFVLFSAIIGQLVLGLLSALLLRRKFLLRPFFNAIILMPNAVPGVVAALMWSSMLATGDYGTLNKIVGWFGIDPQRWLVTFPLTMVIVINIWRGIGFAMILMTSGLSAIPDDLYEAARMDGATAWQTFRRLTLPLMVPTIFLYLLVSTVTTIAIFSLVYALTRGGPAGATEIIGIYVYNQSFDAYRLGYGSAIAVVLLIFSLFIGMFYVRALKVEV